MWILWPDVPQLVLGEMIREMRERQNMTPTPAPVPAQPKSRPAAAAAAVLAFLGKRLIGVEDAGGEIALTFDDGTQLIAQAAPDGPPRLRYYAGRWERTLIG
jgi:hypothetical protein